MIDKLATYLVSAHTMLIILQLNNSKIIYDMFHLAATIMCVKLSTSAFHVLSIIKYFV